MATEEKAAHDKKDKKPHEGGKGEKGAKGGKGGKGGKRQATSAEKPRDHAGVGLPVPPPRLRTYYVSTVRPNLAKQFGLSNVHEIPSLEKIVLNVGMGEAIKQPKVLDAVVDECGIISGHS